MKKHFLLFFLKKEKEERRNMEGKLARAIADNPGEARTELVFKKGDIIRIADADTGADGWWEGELLSTGEDGFFPSSFVVVLSDEESERVVDELIQQEMALEQQELEQQQQREQELEQQRAQKEMEKKKAEEKKRNDAKTSSKKTQQQSQANSSDDSKWVDDGKVRNKMAKVIFSYTSDNKEDLTVEDGDVIYYADIPGNPEWVDARKGNKKGFVPTSFIKPLDEDGSSPAAAGNSSIYGAFGVFGSFDSIGQSTQSTSFSTASSSSSSPSYKTANATKSFASTNANATKTATSTSTPIKTTPAKPVPTLSTATPNKSNVSSQKSPRPDPVTANAVPLNTKRVNAVSRRVTGLTDQDAPFYITENARWKEITPVTVSVSVGGQKEKFSGFKKYTFYTITSLPKGPSVNRRYKHFDWLNQRLMEEFPIIPLPPLPEKQISGRFDDEVVEYRKRHLEHYLNYCTHHPILGTSQVIKFFIENPGEVTEWKAGKRAAEKEAKGSGDLFLQRVQVENTVDSCRATNMIISFKRHTAAHQRALLALAEAQTALTEKMRTLSAEFDCCAEKLALLNAEKCWEGAGCKVCTKVSKGVKGLINIYKEEKQFFTPSARQPNIEDAAYLFKSLSGAFGALDKRMEAAENALIKKSPSEEIAADNLVRTRAVMVAELFMFHERQDKIMSKALLDSAQEEVRFHKRMVEQWQNYIKENK